MWRHLEWRFSRTFARLHKRVCIYVQHAALRTTCSSVGTLSVIVVGFCRVLQYYYLARSLSIGIRVSFRYNIIITHIHNIRVFYSFARFKSTRTLKSCYIYGPSNVTYVVLLLRTAYDIRSLNPITTPTRFSTRQQRRFGNSPRQPYYYRRYRSMWKV